MRPTKLLKFASVLPVTCLTAAAKQLVIDSVQELTRNYRCPIQVNMLTHLEAMAPLL